MTIEEKERIYTRLQEGDPFTIFSDLEDRVYQFQKATDCFLLYLNDSYIGSWRPKQNEKMANDFIEVKTDLFKIRKPNLLWLKYIVFISDRNQ